MNLETQIKPELWAAIASSYQAENYTHAIRDAMALMTETLRDKSGLDGDGETLAGKALGFSEGKLPLIRINKLQTQSEQDEQKGFLLVVKGMYALIRNPRSHERLSDTQEIADKVILFLDYLLDLLGASRQSFTVQDFLVAVTERHFVKDTEYVEELVSTVPIRKLGDTLIAVYRAKNWKQADNFQMVMSTILAKLDDAQINDFLSVVSEELMRADKIGDVTLVLKVLPDQLWPRLQKMARLRAENMLLEELTGAWYVPSQGETNSPASTWISRVVKPFLRKYQLQSTIIDKMHKEDFDQHNFIANYLMAYLPYIFQEEWEIQACVESVAHSVRSGNKFVKDSLVRFLTQSAPVMWTKKFAASLEDLTDQEKPEVLLPENGPSSRRTLPFLGKFVESANPASQPASEDDIPF